MSLLFKIFLTVSIDPDRMALPNSFNVVSFWSFDIDMVAAYDFRSQSFTSSMADLHQEDINRVSSLSRCHNETFP